MISIVGKDKAAILAALYNNSTPLGMGWLQYDNKPMSQEEAQTYIGSGQLYFDYLKGRVMKVDLSKDKLDPSLYDRDNGPGAAEQALRQANLLT